MFSSSGSGEEDPNPLYVRENIIKSNGRLAETPDCWIIEFRLESILAYNFGQMIKLSANVHDMSANTTKIVCKCRI